MKLWLLLQLRVAAGNNYDNDNFLDMLQLLHPFAAIFQWLAVGLVGDIGLIFYRKW